ncbi:MAG: MFS transporter [Trebonia sp.]
MESTDTKARGALTRELTGRIHALPMSRWHYGMILLAGSALIFDQADVGIASSAEVSIAKSFGLQPVSLGIVISAAGIGAASSAALIGLLAERFGRRRLIVGSMLLFTLATAAAATSVNLTELLVFRVIAGIGFGGLLPLAWAFGSEFAPARSRGRTLAWLNAFYGAGSAIAYLIGLLVIVHFGWRWGFAAFLVPSLLAFAIARFLPEGIPYLVRRGREQEARAEVERIEATVLGDRPRPEPVSDPAEHAAAAGSVLAATRQLFAREHLAATISVLFAWPVPVIFMLGLMGFYPLIFITDLHLPASEVLSFLTFSAFVTIAGRLASGLVLDRIRAWSPSGLRLSLGIGVVLLGVMPFLVVSVHWNPAQLLTLLCVQFFTQGLWAGAAMTYAPTVFPLAIRSAGLGLFSALTNVASIVGPIVAGALLQFSGLQSLADWTLGVALGSAVLVIAFGRRDRVATPAHADPVPSAATRGQQLPVLTED